MPAAIIVLGGGPVGIEAALTAAHAGAKVTLISNAPIGGRAGWHSLLPSKVWLALAGAAGSHAQIPGLLETNPRVDAGALLSHLRAVRQAWSDAQRQALLDAGVTIVAGTARFSARNQVKITQGEAEAATLNADAFIVASGSVPRFPPAMRPDGERILAPRFAAGLDPLPEEIIVIGGGATGSEFAYLFLALGARVTWLVGEEGILPTFHPDAGSLLAEIFSARGMAVHVGQNAVSAERDGERVTVTLADGSRHSAGHAFLAIGRRPDLDDLNLAAAGLSNGTLPPLDAYNRSPNPRLYFVGDAAGGSLMVNKGQAQARIVAHHAVGRTTPPYNPASALFAIYTEPQVAQVGTVDGKGVAVVRLPTTAALKGRLLAEPAGFVQLTYEPESGLLLGGVAVGDHAADVLAPLALAIHHGMALSDLAPLYVAHPTLSELLFAAARAASWQKKE